MAIDPLRDQPFQPWNAIERRILETRDGRLPADTLIGEIAQADLFIPSAGEVTPDGGGYRPILLEQDDLSLVAVFTAAARVPVGMAVTIMAMKGAHFVRRLPPGHGLIVNPGTDAPIILPPEGVAALKTDLKGQ